MESRSLEQKNQFQKAVENTVQFMRDETRSVFMLKLCTRKHVHIES